MKKYFKTFIKQEKRIVKLLYKKGMLDNFKLEELYWASYLKTGKKYWYGSKGKTYRWPEFYPEVYYSTSDYWGECDEHSVVEHIQQTLYWTHIDERNWNPNNGEMPKSLFKYYGIRYRKNFINYLESLPTKRSDNKIRKVINKIRLDI